MTVGLCNASARRVLLSLCLGALPGCAVSDGFLPIAEQAGPVPGQVSISASATGITLANRSARDICYSAIEEGMLALMNMAPPEQWQCGNPLKAEETSTIAWADVDGAAPQKPRYHVTIWQMAAAPDGRLRAVYHQGVIVLR